MLEICVISKSGSTNKLLARLLRSNLLILYNSCDVGSENLVLDQLIIPSVILFSILITCLFKIVLILKGEILSWSLKRVRRFNTILISNETTASDDMLAHS